MKPNFKVLILSFMIILTIALPQAIYGMEDSSNPDEDVKGSSASRVLSDSDMTKKSQQKVRRVEETRENPFELCPEEITSMILERAALGNYLSDAYTGSLILVCRHWRDIMEQDAMKQSIESMKHEYIYQRFLKGVLIYWPDPQSDEGMIQLRISDLKNPLEGTFDLSQCGNTGKYLTMSTGYRKGKKKENANKLEIWLTPRFLVEKEIQGSAKHFKKIFPSEWSGTAPVGIFWTWGGWDDLTNYDYLVTENFGHLSNNNLYEKWCTSLSNTKSSIIYPTYLHSPRSAAREPPQEISVRFVN